MNKDEYCINICKAKCCRDSVHGITCMHLCADSKCAVYAQRFKPEALESLAVAVQEHQGKLYTIICNRIEKLLRENTLTPEVVSQCCYAHPELLTKESQNEESS